MAEAEEIAEQLATLPPPLTFEEETTYSPQLILHNATQSLLSTWHTAKNYIQGLNNWDERAAHCITDFKRDYIISIGDLMSRSVCMAIAGGVAYKLASLNKPTVMRRTRNLGVCFLLSGWLFVPQLFNPFLPRAD